MSRAEPTPTRDRLVAIAAAMAGRCVLVAGDLVLDRYWFGRSSRLSREAPVLILEFEEERGLPGGAANAAANVRALGGEPRLVGRIGGDPAGVALRRALLTEGVPTRWSVRDASSGTVVKTRILAGSSHTSRQQIVRLDRGAAHAVRPAIERSLMGAATRALRGAAGVLLSDYGYGVVSRALRAEVLRGAARRRIPVVVDSRYALRSYKGATLLTPNEHELAEAYRLPSLAEQGVRRAGEALRRGSAAKSVWVTRGSDGMLVIERGERPACVPIVGTSDVADVTGAGDAVSATATLALAAGASQIEAALLATFAASVVVMKRGTATVSQKELRAAIEAHEVPKVRRR